MLMQSAQALGPVSGATSGAEVAMSFLPSIPRSWKHVGAGGFAGFISGGLKCLHTLESGRLTLPAVARTPGRNTTSGIASGVMSSAAALDVASPGRRWGAVSAPIWPPSLTATAAAIGVGHVVGAAHHEVGDHSASGMQPVSDPIRVSH